MIGITPIASHSAQALAAIHAQAFDDSWSGGEIGALMDGLGAFALCASLEDEAVGFILCRVAADESEVLTIAVRPGARRRGVASALLGAAAAASMAAGAGAMFLEVAEDNAAARSLYLRHGFVQVGRRPAYYARSAGDAAALIMRLDLNT